MAAGRRWFLILGFLLFRHHCVCSFQSVRLGGMERMNFLTQRLAVPAKRDYIDRDSYWVYMFYLLMVYKEREGHCEVPYRHEENEWKLGVWLAKQREAYKLGRMSPVDQQRLEEAGVAWDLYTRKWERMFDRLLQFKEREGHCLVPQNQIEDGETLGSWLNKQRRMKQAGKLGSRRMQLLEEAGVAWHVPDVRWNEMFMLLLQYKDRVGHAQVPIRHQEEGQNLGTWLATQQKAKRRGALKLDRQDRLEKTGIVWDHRHTQKWESMFDRLLQFQQKEGHCLVPQNHTEDGESLGSWLNKQRLLKRTGKLGSRRVQLLEEAGVTWHVPDIKWNQMFRLLLKYRDREGHTQVPKHHQEEGQNLGTWLATQLEAKRKGALKLDRQDRLEKAGIEFSFPLKDCHIINYKVY
eukprot:scaffold25622_cov206-Cylindrotheca_fusiformis.AAC.2